MSVHSLVTRRAIASVPLEVRAEMFELADGARVSVGDASVEVRDSGGRLLVRYAHGNAEVSAPDGDLVLASPRGRVLVQAAAGAVLSSDGDVELRGRAVAVSAEHVAVTAKTLLERVERLEVEARQMVERAEQSFRWVSDLAELRAGRARTLVRELFSLRSRRTSLTSSDDSSIAGRRVLLG